MSDVPEEYPDSPDGVEGQDDNKDDLVPDQEVEDTDDTEFYDWEAAEGTDDEQMVADTTHFEGVPGTDA